MQAALCDLAREPGKSFRQAATPRAVDLGDLYRAARSVPGLLEARREFKGGARRCRGHLNPPAPAQ